MSAVGMKLAWHYDGYTKWRGLSDSPRQFDLAGGVGVLASRPSNPSAEV